MWDSQPVVIFQLSYNELALKKEANHKETTMAMSKSYKSLYCRRTNIRKASSFVITSCTPLHAHFTLISQNTWKDGMTTCTVQPAKQTCKPTIGGLYRFSRGHFQVPSVRFRGWINRSSLTSSLPTQVTCNRISPPVVPAADVQAPTELASSQLPSCHRKALEAVIFKISEYMESVTRKCQAVSLRPGFHVCPPLQRH